MGDARALRLADDSVDAVLLLGPLYLAAAISRFASTLDGLRNGYLEDPTFAAIASQDRRAGQHRNPTRNPAYFTTAYFHHTSELASEFTSAGLVHETTLAIEGPGWFVTDLDTRLADEQRRAVLLEILAAVEAESALLGVSAHLLGIARRP